MRLIVLTLLILLCAPIPSSAQSGKPRSMAELAAYNKPDREKVLYDGAKKEGVVTWYTSLTGGPNTDMPKVFNAKYPGVAVEVYRGDSDALMSRIMQEAQAKTVHRRYHRDDVPGFESNPRAETIAAVSSRRICRLTRTRPRRKTDKGMVYWATDRESYIGLAYNTNSVQGNAVPKNFDDLLKSGVEG